jgi:hypothetical protein
MMQASKTIATYKRLRNEPHWRLLAADHGPIIIAILQSQFLEKNERSIPASIFYERIDCDLELLRASGEDIPQTAQAYAADWLAQGYLLRHFPSGSHEEVYELSMMATTAIRFVAGLVERRTSATESRLATVIHQLTKLAEETDPNPVTRITALLAERERIDREIEAVRQGRNKPLTDATALERMREIIALSDDLIGDFHRVRDEFEQLNRDLRRQIMDYDGSRGTILDALFDGVDVISNSEAGRTFAAFWRLLIDPEQSATLENGLAQLFSRHFTSQLELRERRFLLHLTHTLLDQSGSVHDVLQHFSRSLKHFVQSREFLEHRRLNHLLKEAQRAALSIKDDVKITNAFDYPLMLTSITTISLAQLTLHDPSLYTIENDMTNAEVSQVDLEMISNLVAQSEIDFRSLKANILKMLQEYAQVTINEILRRFPATQGLGSIIGYLALGSRHGLMAEHHETINWTGGDGEERSARIPVIYFLRDRSHELA